MMYSHVSVFPASRENVLWEAHCRVVDHDWRGWGKIVVWADSSGVHGPAENRVDTEEWFRWTEVKDVAVRRVQHGLWWKRFAVAFIFEDTDRSDVELMVSSRHWWGFYSPIVAVETAAWLRECRVGKVSSFSLE